MIRASAPYTSGWGSFVLLKMDCFRLARGGSLSMLHRPYDLLMEKLQPSLFKIISVIRHIPRHAFEAIQSGRKIYYILD